MTRASKSPKATRDERRTGLAVLAEGPRAWQGMNWIRKEKRLAIYLRDGLACVWCASGAEDVKLTLDHLRPRSKAGGHEAVNLVTACHRCNSSRGSRPVAAFSRTVAAYLNHGVTAESVAAHVTRSRRRVLDVRAAKDLIARRGSFAAALSGERE